MRERPVPVTGMFYLRPPSLQRRRGGTAPDRAAWPPCRGLGVQGLHEPPAPLLLALFLRLARAHRPGPQGTDLQLRDGRPRGRAAEPARTPRPSPFGHVPVLEVLESGQRLVLVESMAILHYLEERFPEPPLLPKDLPGRARVRALAEHVNSAIQPLQNSVVQRFLRERGPGLKRPSPADSTETAWPPWRWRCRTASPAASATATPRGSPTAISSPNRRRAPARRGRLTLPDPPAHRGGLQRAPRLRGRPPRAPARRTGALTRGCALLGAARRPPSRANAASRPLCGNRPHRAELGRGPPWTAGRTQERAAPGPCAGASGWGAGRGEGGERVAGLLDAQEESSRVRRPRRAGARRRSGGRNSGGEPGIASAGAAGEAVLQPRPPPAAGAWVKSAGKGHFEP